MAGLLALGGAGAIVLGTAESAAAFPVSITSPLGGDPVTDTPFLFTGVADPNEPVEVDPGAYGTICSTTANAGGNWSCPVVFTNGGANVNVIANGLTSGTSDAGLHDIALPPAVNEQVPGTFYSNQSAPPFVTGTTDPNATVNGTIGPVACSGVANALGAYTCTGVGPLIGLDGPRVMSLTSTPLGALSASAPTPSTYMLDTSTFIPDFSYPYDTIGPGANVFTTDSTPVIGGIAGTAELYGTVNVHGYQYSAVGVSPPWPVPPPDPFFVYCSTLAAADGSWSCTGAVMLVNAVWVLGSTQSDYAGNSTGSPDAEFSVQILPPPPAPTVLLPVIGYQSLLHRVHVSTLNLAQGTMYVREGGVDRCTPAPVAVATFSCTTVPLSVGVHHLSIFQADQYGTLTPAVQRTVTILAPLPIKYLTFQFRVIGPDGVVGDEGLQAGDEITIEADGLPIGTIITTEIHSTPISLGSTTIGPSGSFSMPATVPNVDAGEHEIVVLASAPGYEPATVASPVQVRDVKRIPEEADEVKVLGEPSEETIGPGTGSGGGGGPGGGGFDDPTTFGSALSSPFDLQARLFQLTVAGVALSGSLGIGFLLLVGLPAELLESTIRSNYDRAFGWLARIRRRLGQIAAPIARVLANPWVGSGLTILAASVLLGFADPGYGFNGASARLTLAMLIAVVAINVGLTTIVMRVAKRAFDVRGMLQPMPAALALVGISVLVSRLAGISPGFLFGIVLGVVYARDLKLRDEGRLGALGVGLTLAAGLLAWLGYGIASTASGPGFWNNLLIEILAAITLEALGTLVIALLPIDFLDGRTIFRWSKPAWSGLYIVTLLVFLFVVVPMSGNWGAMTAPIFGWSTLFVVFGVVAIATWALFRRFPPKNGAATPSSRPAESAPPRSRR